MAKKNTRPVPSFSVDTLEEADKVLLRIATASLKLKKLEAEAQATINAAKEKLAAARAPLDAQIEELEAPLLEFANVEYRQLFGEGKKSVTLTFGKLTCRRSSKLVVKSIEKTLALLHEKGWKDAIVVKEQVNKEALSGYTDDDLKSVAVKRLDEEVISYQVDEEKAAERIAS